MPKFATRTLGDDVFGSDRMKITPLGAGNEVGRSCLIVEFKGRTIMVFSACRRKWPFIICSWIAGFTRRMRA